MRLGRAESSLSPWWKRIRNSTVSLGLRSKCVTSDERRDAGKLRDPKVKRTRAAAASGEWDTRSSVSLRVATYASL